jgi:hypothetical protein
VNELPSMEEFEKLVAESFQAELIPAESAVDVKPEVVEENIGAREVSIPQEQEEEPAEEKAG